MRKIGFITTALVALVSMLVAVLPASAQAAPVSYRGATVVALGDSRASGNFQEGLESQLGCGRSAAAFTSRAATLIGASNFTNAACGGAKGANIWRDIQWTGRFPNPVQLSVAPRNAQVVLVSTGMNDLDWHALKRHCTNSNGSNRDKNCRGKNRKRATQGLARMRTETRAALGAIRKQYPNAKIVVLGPGGLVADRACRNFLPIGQADAKWIGGVFDRASKIQSDIAKSVGAEYVDIQAHAKKHGICSGAQANWFSGAHATGGNLRYHMNERGAAAIAGLVRDALTK